jgi:peroxiredoxin Q/BCP
VVLGISPDKPSAQKKFKEKFGFPFSLLADEDKSIAKRFGVLKEKSMYGRKYMGIERTTFVISAEGKIAAIISGIKADEHPQAALMALQGKHSRG